MGTIVACGDVQAVKLEDVVLFAPEAGQEVEYQDQRYLVLTEDELIAVLE
jgi:co-chaperonin GroES (HSP10)